MSRFSSLRKGKCPKCEEGKIFETNGNILKLKGPKMYDNCPQCDFKFEREPGYFFGAMFVSYGITTAEAIATFVAIRVLGIEMSVDMMMAIITAVMLIFLFPNFKLSRILWLYLFTKKNRANAVDTADLES